MRLAIIILAGCGIVLGREPNLGTDAQRAAGREVYLQKCASCHGREGDGKGNVFGFNPMPRDFTSSTYKIRTTPSGELPTHEDLKSAILRGMPETGMLAWPGLSEEELDNVTYYIKTFDETFADPDALVDPITIPEPLPFSQESADSGRKLYEENKCGDCHGELGRGNGPSAPTQEDAYFSMRRPADLTKRWTYRGHGEPKDIFRSITTGLDGTGMASYQDLVSDEGRWHLVNYLLSISEAVPDFGTLVIASGSETKIDLAKGDTLFENAEPGNFPVFGQIIEAGRNFYPAINKVEVRAVYDSTDIAIMLTYHDMVADLEKSNSPTAAAPAWDPEDKPAGGEFSDAVAIQVPTQMPDGFIKPYFLFGDKKKSVDLWYKDLSDTSSRKAQYYLGKGSKSLSKAESDIEVISKYDNGRWQVIFKRARRVEGRLPFEEEKFIPIAFSFWDGHNKDRGNRRCLTSWYHLYMKPIKVESPLKPAAKAGVIALIIELGLLYFLRKRFAGKRLS